MSISVCDGQRQLAHLHLVQELPHRGISLVLHRRWNRTGDDSWSVIWLIKSCCSWTLQVFIILFQHGSLSAGLRCAHLVPGVLAELQLLCQSVKGPASLWGDLQRSDHSSMVCQRQKHNKPNQHDHGCSSSWWSELSSTLSPTPGWFVVKFRTYLLLIANWMLDILLAQPAAGCRRHFSQVKLLYKHH